MCDEDAEVKPRCNAGEEVIYLRPPSFICGLVTTHIFRLGTTDLAMQRNITSRHCDPSRASIRSTCHVWGTLLEEGFSAQLHISQRAVFHMWLDLRPRSMK